MPPDFAASTPEYYVSIKAIIKDLYKLPTETQNSIRHAIDCLEDSPGSPKHTKTVVPPGSVFFTMYVDSNPPYAVIYRINKIDEEHHEVVVWSLEPSHFQQAPAPPEPEWGHFVLDIELNDQGFSARPTRTPEGSQPDGGTSQLSYDEITLEAVLKVLESREKVDLGNFDEAEINALRNLNLLSEGSDGYELDPQKQVLEELGKELFTSLLPGDSADALKKAFDTNVRLGDRRIAIQLCIPDEAEKFGRYPWELLHDGHRHYVTQERVEVTRLIKYGEGARKLVVEDRPVRLLFISAHPKDLSTIPNDELVAVWEALREGLKSEYLEFDELDPPTWDNLRNRLGDESKPYHIIHFDGHGDFYKKCPQCGKPNGRDVDKCKCGQWIANVDPSAHLAFEDNNENADFVDSTDIENFVVQAGHVKLVFLSACQSGWIQGKSLFSGLGPALIRGGVPAVVAMQFSMPTSDAAKFAEGFYEVLAEKGTLVRAMDEGRQKLCDMNVPGEPGKWKTWYLPTLYLRTMDDDKEGLLFPE